PVPLVALDHVRNDFGVRLGADPVPVCRERLSKLAVILDDPVVDDGESGLAIDVGMSIGVRRPSVGCPPRMTNTEGALRPVGGDQCLEIRDFSGRLSNVERLSGYRGDPRRVVPSVLQPTKAG